MHTFLLSVSSKKKERKKKPKMVSEIKNVFGTKEVIGIVI